MNRADLIAAVAAETEATKIGTERTLDCLLKHIQRAVSQGVKVKLQGFGTFEAVQCGPRCGRNPKTGVAIPIAASRKPKFTPGTDFKKKVGRKSFSTSQ